MDLHGPTSTQNAYTVPTWMSRKTKGLQALTCKPL